MHYTLGLAVVFLCASSAYSVEEAWIGPAYEPVPQPEAHLMRVPTTTQRPEDATFDYENRDCEAMSQCNLTDAVPGNDVKFSELPVEEKIRICSSLKTSHDCSSLYTCKRMAKFVAVVHRFYNFICTKILNENGISTENCYKSAHPKAVAKCSNHLQKMKSLVNESEGKEAIRVACCEHHNYSNCYRSEVSSACGMDRSAVAVQPDPNFDKYCHQWTSKHCREQRELKPNSMGVSSSGSISGGIFSIVIASLGIYLVGRH